MKKGLIIVIIGGLLLFSSSAFAMGSPKGHGRKGPQGYQGPQGPQGPQGSQGPVSMGPNQGDMGECIPWGRIGDILNLSPQQRKEIKKHKHNMEKEIIKDDTELRLKMLDLRYALKEDRIDDANIEKLTNEIAEIQKKLLRDRIKSLRQVRAVLNPEQWDKFKNMEPTFPGPRRGQP